MKNVIKTSKLVLMVGTCVFITGCAATGLSNSKSATILTPSQSFDTATYDAQNAPQNYNPTISEKVFLVGDTATITVNGFEEFSGTYIVDTNGNILLGHIGNVKVEGLSVPQLQTNLFRSYQSCCLVNPNVSVEREGQAFGNIVVDGAVNNAGVFEIDEVIKLSQAIALGGGASELANREKVVLARVINGERRVSPVNLKSIQIDGADDPLVYPNDVIFVQDSAGRLIYNDFVSTIPLLSSVIIAATRR